APAAARARRPEGNARHDACPRARTASRRGAAGLQARGADGAQARRGGPATGRGPPLPGVLPRGGCRPWRLRRGDGAREPDHRDAGDWPLPSRDRRGRCGMSAGLIDMFAAQLAADWRREPYAAGAVAEAHAVLHAAMTADWPARG